ncbi:unnamed protein product [Ilex paraguariensis]|uniref:Sulfotransferase n=1 Tax=Ilex paraguariensis TaxID=185542 RepID=A0ABC8R3X9_9AQUA
MKENSLPSRALKKSPNVLWMVLIFAVVVTGFYIRFVSFNHVIMPLKPKELPIPGSTGALCELPELPSEEIRFVHFPRPRTYSREECVCNPVRNFVLLSMQRSGSGWFETLLNSHPTLVQMGKYFL